MKIIFLDVDGTIFNTKKQIPDSTLQAICSAREKGNKVFICTGRSPGQIPKNLRDVGFDGMICSAGAYAEVEGSVLYHNPLPEEEIALLLDVLIKYEIPYILEQNGTSKGNQRGVEIMREFQEEAMRYNSEGAKDFIGELAITERPYLEQDINKVLFFESCLDIEDLQRETKGHFTIIESSISEFSGSSGEISSPGVSKATGMETVLAYYEMESESTIAIGDGPNDYEMLEYAGIGIAMGNASESLKKIATYITASVDEDGIYKAFEQFRLH